VFSEFFIATSERGLPKDGKEKIFVSFDRIKPKKPEI